jgi:hypothetical protein
MISRPINALVLVAITVSFACAPAPNANLNANASRVETAVIANSNTGAAAGRGPRIIREPERYSARITISAQTTGSTSATSTRLLQFDFAKLAADRRAAFQLPTTGQAIYLERAGLCYFIQPERKQYAELNRDVFGIDLTNLTTAAVMVLESRTQHEILGGEAVDGRMATKYRFSGQVAKTQIDGIVYVDESTGLPIRSEIVAQAANGIGSRILIEMRDVQLNPDATMFDVPIGFRKVTGQELKQQIQSLADALRALVTLFKQELQPAR